MAAEVVLEVHSLSDVYLHRLVIALVQGRRMHVDVSEEGMVEKLIPTLALMGVEPQAAVEEVHALGRNSSLLWNLVDPLL